MVEVRYLPAPAADAWRVAASGRVLAALPPAVSAQTAEAVWRRLADGGIGALIEALTGAFGTSLTAIPPFVLAVVEDDGVRIAVRGGLEVVVEGAEGAVAVTAGGTATWAERVVPQAHRVTVELSGGFDSVDALPLAAGIAPAVAVVLTVDGGIDVVPVAAPARSASAAPARDDAPASGSESAPEPASADVLASAPVSAAASAPVAAWEEAAAGVPEAPLAAAPDAAPVMSTLAPDALLETVMTDRTRAKVAAGGDAPVPGPGFAEPDADAQAESESAAESAEVADPHAEPDGSETWIPGATEGPIDAVPFTSAGAPPFAGGAASASASESAPGGDAAVSGPPTDWLVQGDHDGATISVAEARRLRGEQQVFEPVADVPARQPAQGRIRLSTGQIIELERPVVIGRRPRSTRTSGDDLPTLVAVESPEHDISRSHVEIRAEGEHVLVTDLDTTNGTVLKRIGADPVRLHPGEPTMVVDGDVLDIGDGVTIAFEGLL